MICKIGAREPVLLRQGRTQRDVLHVDQSTSEPACICKLVQDIKLRIMLYTKCDRSSAGTCNRSSLPARAPQEIGRGSP